MLKSYLFLLLITAALVTSHTNAALSHSLNGVHACGLVSNISECSTSAESASTTSPRLNQVSAQCVFVFGVGTQAIVKFEWAPVQGVVAQWLDLSLFDNDFAPGSFIATGPLEAGTAELSWGGIAPGVAHFWRVNALTANGWLTSETGTFVPCGAPALREISQECWIDGRSDVTFSWSQAIPAATQQWLDLSVFGNSFRAETFVAAGPLTGSTNILVWKGIVPNREHFWRVNGFFNNEWASSETGTFIAAC